MKKQISRNDIETLDFFNIEDEIEKNKLINFWGEVPLTQRVDSEQFGLINSHAIRNAFMRLLRKGVKIDNNTTLRALSIKDLKELVNLELGRGDGKGQKDDPVKYTTLYYHRDKLLEEGLIQEVSEVLIGRRRVAFYGRTAKAFLAKETLGYKDLDIYQKLNEFMLEMNPDLSQKELENLYKEISGNMKLVSQEFNAWIEEHVDLINKHDVDVIELFQFFSRFYLVHPLIKEQSLKIGKYLELPIFQHAGEF